MKPDSIALVTLLISGFVPVACHRAAPVERSKAGTPVVRDTSRVVPVLEDTSPVRVSPPGVRTFKLRNPGQRDSLRSTLRRERALWRASGPRNYQFLLRAQCFCPGNRGWLLIEARNGVPVLARDAAGKSIPLTDLNTHSIDGMFDNLERMVDVDAEVRIAFDPRWHFPAYISTVRHPGPDNWSIVEARDFRPI